VNSGFHPRAGSADTAVQWADSFAKFGYPCFRFDLPGLGDSDGHLPPNVLDFLDLVNAAHYAPVLSDLAKSLCERFRLAGVVLMGHCAGGVSALFTASVSKHIKGVVVLNPYFHEEDARTTTIRNEFRSWIPESRIAGALSRLYDRFKYIRRMIVKNRLPPNANSRLIRSFKQLASAGTPVLFLQAVASNQRVGDFDYVAHIQRSARRVQRIEVKRVENTNHSFFKGTGKTAVEEYALTWLDRWFPLTVADASRARVTKPHAADALPRGFQVGHPVGGD
jgi:pimeloyl-ACP methyl ester carboxylesterase